MSDRYSKRPKLAVLEGGRKIGEPFESSAQLTPVPTLPNAENLKRLTANSIMHDMFEAFQEAHELNFGALGIIKDNTGGFQYVPVKDKGELIEYVVKPQLTNVENLKPDGLELVFIFDLTAPFEDQFSEEYIKNVRSKKDILQAFIDIAEQYHFDDGYKNLPDLTPKPQN
jgi:hypothetical protein